MATQSSQSDRVLLTLRQMLLTGAFAPGERLTELELVSRIGASRTPVRHALNALAHEGLLEPWPGGGFGVRSFVMEDVWDAIELRGVLEGTAARLAAERLADDSALAGLRRHLDALEGQLPLDLDDFARYLDANDRFHAALVALSRSRILTETLDNLMQLPFARPSALVFGEAEVAVARRTADIAQEHHRAIVEAIAARAGTRAEALAREHAQVARRVLERALQDMRLADRVPGARLIALSVAV